MILKIKDALGSIKPDDELIYRTEQILSSKTQTKHTYFYGKPVFSKLSLAACLLLIVGTMSVSAYSYYQQPVNYLDIDINPSLELKINRLERVVAVDYYNEDAENLIDEKTLRGNKPEEAVTLVLDAARDKGYISQDKASVVSLAAIGNDVEKADKILNDCSDTVKNKYNQVAVFSSKISPDIKKEAQSKSISAGKLNLIKMVQTLDETATVEDYKDASVNEIVEKLAYLSSESNKDVTEGKKSSVSDGLKDVNDQMNKIKEKLNQNEKQQIEPQNNNNSGEDTDKNSENKTETKNSSSKHNSASKSDGSDATQIPKESEDFPKKDYSEDLPVNGHQQADKQSGKDSPMQNGDHSQISGKQQGQAEYDSKK